MKRITVYMILLMFAVSCKSISYQNAVHSNQDKFYGEKEQEAILLVELKDLSQLAEDLSGVAQEKAYSKDLFEFAEMAEKDHKKFQFRMEILAFKKGIKLPDAISVEKQEIYRKLHKIEDKKTFDIHYLAEMENLLDSMTIKSDDYLEEGKDKQIRNFITKHTGMFKGQMKRIENMQNYIEKSSSKELSMNKN